MRPLNNIPQFDSSNRFDAVRMAADDNDKESDKQLNQTEPYSHPPWTTKSKTRTKAPTFDCKKSFWQCYYEISKPRKTWFDKEFLRHKNWEYKVLCKIHAGKTICASNYSCWYKNADEIANKIVKFTNSITSKNNVVVSGKVSRKNRFNNKAKKEHNLQLIQHHNINPFRHTNAKFVFKYLWRQTINQTFYKFYWINICKYMYALKFSVSAL